MSDAHNIDPGYAPDRSERAATAFAAAADDALSMIADLLAAADMKIVEAHDAGYLTPEEYEATSLEDISATIDVARMKRSEGE